MILLLLLACRSPALPPPEPPPGEPMRIEPAAVPSTATEATRTAHPGTITFYDRDTGVTRVDDVAKVPESIAWWEGDGRRVAVTRIETSQAGGAREIFRFGADGALLDVTTGR